MKYNYWTNKEIVLLRQHYPTSTKSEICELIPRHTYGSISKIASMLKLGNAKIYWMTYAHQYFEARKKSNLTGGFKMRNGGAPGADAPPPAFPDYERKSE